MLIYPDVREAVAWLTGAFGFAERVRIGDTQRSQLRFGDGALAVAEARATAVRKGTRDPVEPGQLIHNYMA